MKKTITLSLFAALTLPAMAASNAELEAMLLEMKKEFHAYKSTQDKKVAALEKELASTKQTKKSTPTKTKQAKTTPTQTLALTSTNDKQPTVIPTQTKEEEKSFLETASDVVTADTYESFSDLGLAASKVYYSDTALSIGGYGEYKFKKYNDYKNFASSVNNDTRNKAETNVVRFVPYIGFKFNEWIVMNTEIEFEDGGARSDNENNYKYAIVEFSYLDFLLDEKYNLRVGHILVPFGNINLNHEPVAFLTSERPLVETFIIPSTWHTNGALLHGNIDDVEYYAGVVTSPDAGDFVEGRFVQQGRQGARQFTDDYSGVARVVYKGISGFDMGGSLAYGQTSALAQDKPGDAINTLSADFSLFMAEGHINYKAEGWNVQALAAYGSFGDGYTNLNTATNRISKTVNGEYLTVGYDFLHNASTSHTLYGVAEVERLDLDADNETSNPDNYKFNEYTLGLAYYPDPKVVFKADFNIRDYAENASLADENAFIASLGFIF
ncbi:MAG TPA: hypothetical protein PLH07_05160 [Sulfurovum sp.]|jgi:hypothetical protein|nr:MAG: hypothetical protein B7Y63_07940 [Sulfurovum sp. 35-42-20]OYZ25940.1 MAG: hypothetical protein B7Y23_03775 [Sulfurovum sp. 16-42-52]OYZ48024.1 MAG: hypothetical protein B7Y13_08860 [Sulfurovum sp. 24-42-9]OZA46829.1 MAG: hypothetical protein B7X80_01165 [Sulfurovum sp. 17-42-90]OZA59132.1 MAG: hypothetical protein B7X69_09200 [Sulfurovum sp. 39-42-12]HQR74218.1 hypothetical protein [Sulfurovum sp.]